MYKVRKEYVAQIIAAGDCKGLIMKSLGRDFRICRGNLDDYCDMRVIDSLSKATGIIMRSYITWGLSGSINMSLRRGIRNNLKNPQKY